jgi:hypothetical protein
MLDYASRHSFRPYGEQSGVSGILEQPVVNSQCSYGSYSSQIAVYQLEAGREKRTLGELAPGSSSGSFRPVYIAAQIRNAVEERFEMSGQLLDLENAAAKKRDDALASCSSRQSNHSVYLVVLAITLRKRSGQSGQLFDLFKAVETKPSDTTRLVVPVAQHDSLFSQYAVNTVPAVHPVVC